MMKVSRADEYVKIFDTTLRDGEQTPGVSLTPDEKVEIAVQLDKLGVDTIEAGFPITSEGERIAVKKIGKAGLSCEICGLARAEKADIDAVLECDLNYIHTFLASSDIHLKYKLKLTREQALQRAAEAVEYAKSHGVLVEFSAEDATRSDPEYLKQMFKDAVDAGADRIDIPDTVGYTTPSRMSEIVRMIKGVVDVPISVHCHDDFGLAVANSIAGVQAGASCVHATINGLGERAGNASLEEVVMALHELYRKKTRIDTKRIYETSRLVAGLTGVIIQPNKAIVGENAFGHESGIHTHGVLFHPPTYEPIEPGILGRRRWLQAGKHAGTHGVGAMLKELGIQTTKEQLNEILRRVKDLGDKGKEVTETDLIAIAATVTKQTSLQQRVVQLLDLAVMTGVKVVPTASVRLSLDGKDYVVSETGVGPVDSAVKAIQKITSNLANIRLKEYKLEAITGGSDALAEVRIKVEDKDGNIASARAAGEDIVIASVEAMIEGINRMLLRRGQPKPLEVEREGV